MLSFATWIFFCATTIYPMKNLVTSSTTSTPAKVTPVSAGEMKSMMITTTMTVIPALNYMEKFEPSASCMT